MTLERVMSSLACPDSESSNSATVPYKDSVSTWICIKQAFAHIKGCLCFKLLPTSWGYCLFGKFSHNPSLHPEEKKQHKSQLKGSSRNPSFWRMKQQRSFSTPLEWDAGPLDFSLSPSPSSLHILSDIPNRSLVPMFTLWGGKGHCVNKVSFSSLPHTMTKPWLEQGVFDPISCVLIFMPHLPNQLTKPL